MDCDLFLLLLRSICTIVYKFINALKNFRLFPLSTWRFIALGIVQCVMIRVRYLYWEKILHLVSSSALGLILWLFSFVSFIALSPRVGRPGDWAGCVCCTETGKILLNYCIDWDKSRKDVGARPSRNVTVEQLDNRLVLNSEIRAQKNERTNGRTDGGRIHVRLRTVSIIQSVCPSVSGRDRSSARWNHCCCSSGNGGRTDERQRRNNKTKILRTYMEIFDKNF